MDEQENSYYDQLRQEIGNTDYEHYEPVSPPSGENGFGKKERKIITILCVFFLALVLLIRGGQLFDYLGRDRELTVENHKKYVQVDVVALNAVNPTDYDVVVTAKREISSVQITVTLTHSSYTQKEESKTIRFSVGGLEKGEEYRYGIQFDKVTLCRRVEVVAISGRIA